MSTTKTAAQAKDATENITSSRRPGSARAAEMLTLSVVVLFMEVACMRVPSGDSPITERSRSSRDTGLWGGPITARAARDLVLQDVPKLSRAFELRSISSGEDIDQEGRSQTWRFVFAFPTRKGLGVFEVEPCGDPDESTLCLATTLSPEVTSRQETALPTNFVDSDQAARELAGSGVDWVAGPTNLSLATRRRPDGSVVWFGTMDGKDYETPFEPTAR